MKNNMCEAAAAKNENFMNRREIYVNITKAVMKTYVYLSH
jgi:hypothetical protein